MEDSSHRPSVQLGDGKAQQRVAAEIITVFAHSHEPLGLRLQEGLWEKTNEVRVLVSEISPNAQPSILARFVISARRCFGDMFRGYRGTNFFGRGPC